MLTTIFLFLVGVVLLVYGADSLVRGASALAEQFRIPKSVAGLTMVALGTSAPELFVNVLAALEGNTTFALANVSGSNLANMCLGFGICGVIGGISISRHEFGWDLLVKCYSAEPRRMMRLEVAEVAEGKAADLIVFDPKGETTFSKDFMKSKSSNTPFYNQTLKGSIDLVVLGDEMLLER